MDDEHNHLLRIVTKLRGDFQPMGSIDRDCGAYRGDCSCGCKFYIPLKGELGNDWGVCSNPESKRCGLLTFEHQGCLDFEEGLI